MKKAENKWWSRLLKQAGKPPVFLKVDWDKWIDEDEEGKDNKREFNNLPKQSSSSIRTFLFYD